MLVNKIKHYRLLANLSQQELAKRINKDKSTISRYENNEIQPPDLIKLKIAEVLNRDVMDIFFQNNVESKSTNTKSTA
jgi:putative transcriptional regulator